MFKIKYLTIYLFIVFLILLTVVIANAICVETKYTVICFPPDKIEANKVIDKIDSHVLAVAKYYPESFLEKFKVRINITTAQEVANACSEIKVPEEYVIVGCTDYSIMQIFIFYYDECVLYHELTHIFDYLINPYLSNHLREERATDITFRINKDCEE